MPGGWGILGSSGLRQKLSSRRVQDLENYVHNLANNSLQMDSSGNVDISGILNIATTGELQQGTGTLGVDFTGLRMWNDTGIGRIGGYNNDVLQWYNDTNGKLLAGAGAVTIDSSGITLLDGSNAINQIKWIDGTSGDQVGAIYSENCTTWVGGYRFGAGSNPAQVILVANDTYANPDVDVRMGITAEGYGYCNTDFRAYDGLSVGTQDAAGTGEIQYNGNLKAYRNATYYTGYITVPLTAPLTSTSYDGDAYNNVAVTKIDTSVSFGAPAGIKGAFVKLTARDSAAWGTTGLYAAILPLTSSVLPAVEVWPAGGDVLISNSGLVACDSNGDFCWTCNTSGGAVGATMDIWIEIHGYVI